MKTITIFSLLSAVATQALARTIVLGTHPQFGFTPEFQGVWLSGDNPCGGTTLLANGDASPCGNHFSLDGFNDLHFENCGAEPL
jgi:hypothetical protein